MNRLFFMVVAILVFGLISGCTQSEDKPSTTSQGGSQTAPLSATSTEEPKDEVKEVPSPTPTVKEEVQKTPDPTPTTTEATPAAKNQSEPKFEEYPVTDPHRGNTAPVKLNSETRMFKTRFREAAKGTPNFGGRYILATWGCGTDCLMGGVIDAKTGETYMIPFSICCIYEKDPDADKVEIRNDSRLIKFNGLLNENESNVFRHYYLFENGKFVKVAKNK